MTIDASKRASHISTEIIAKAVKLAETKTITEIAEEIGLTYPQARALLHNNGATVIRGRRQGSGVGIRVSPERMADRRVAKQVALLQKGRCTSCGKKNDSKSLYHCLKCLRKRNANKRKQKKK